MNEVQQFQLDILIKLDEICHKHGLRYYLAYGTCIGAMRNKGFIPWDHDIDVLMPIDDAIKLPKYQNEFGERYFVSNFRTDENYKNTNYKIFDRDIKCKFIKKGKETKIGNPFLDVYPFYTCPPSRIGLLLNIWRSHIYKMLVMGPPKNHGKILALTSKFILLFYPSKNRIHDIERIEKKLNYKGNGNEIADYFGEDISICSVIKYKKDWFAEPTKLIFEGIEFDGPTDPDKYLTKRYGDYMTPPDENSLTNLEKVILI